MLKSCPEHGDFRVLFWRDADMYERWMKQGVHAPAKDRGKPEKRGCPYDCGASATSTKAALARVYWR